MIKQAPVHTPAEAGNKAEARRPLRVLHFCRSFSPLSETFIYDSIIALEREGIDNRVLTFQRLNAETRPFKKVHLIEPHRAVWFGRAWRRVRERLFGKSRVEPDWPGLRKRIEAVVDEISPDAIHAHFGYEGGLIAPVAESRKIPLFVSFYGYDISRLPRGEQWRDRYHRLWHKSAGVFVLSQSMRERAIELGCPEELITVVRLSRDLESSASRGVRHPVRHFISIGRLTEKKGHLDAVRAIAKLSEEYPDVRLEIIGEGELRPELERQIQDLKLQDRVALLGALPNSEALARMVKAEAFLLCSRTASDGDSEGTPTVLIEAQMLGLPCVSTCHSGIPEVIPPENHWLLAREGDLEGIIRCLRQLMECPPDRLAYSVWRGMQYVQKHYNLQKETRKLVAAYQKIFARCTALMSGLSTFLGSELGLHF